MGPQQNTKLFSFRGEIDSINYVKLVLKCVALMLICKVFRGQAALVGGTVFAFIFIYAHGPSARRLRQILGKVKGAELMIALMVIGDLVLALIMPPTLMMAMTVMAGVMMTMLPAQLSERVVETAKAGFPGGSFARVAGLRATRTGDQ